MTEKIVKDYIEKQRTIYVAIDGKEFDDKDSCKTYDSTFAAIMHAELNKFAINQGTEESMYFAGSYDNETIVVIPRDEKDILTIKQAVLGCGPKIEYVEKWMEGVVPGDVVMITFSWDNEWAYIDTLNKLVDRISNSKYKIVEK